MVAATKNRLTDEIAEGRAGFGDPVAAAVRIFRGTMVGLTSAGNATPATPTVPRMRGVAREEADNLTGAAGDKLVETARGVFRMGNNGTVNRTHVGANVFVLDDQTVAATGTLVAGKCLQVDTAGVWVEIL